MFFDLKRENKQNVPSALGDKHGEHNGNTKGTAEGELNHRGTEAQWLCLRHGRFNNGEHD